MAPKPSIASNNPTGPPSGPQNAPAAEYGFSITKNGLVGPPLTFGIEVELLIAILKDRKDTKITRELSPGAEGQEIVRAFLSKDLQARCRNCHHYVRFKLPLTTYLETRYKVGDEYATWSIVPEFISASAEEHQLGEDIEKYHLQGIEIKSRILSVVKDLAITDKRVTGCDLHHISYQEEINSVLRALRNGFCQFPNRRSQNEPPKLHYLLPSRNSSLHVHVGNAGKPWELQDLQKLICMGLACERIIDTVHATQRIGWTALTPRVHQNVKPTNTGYGTVYSDRSDVYNCSLPESLILDTYSRLQRKKGIDTNIVVTNDTDIDDIDTVLILIRF